MKKFAPLAVLLAVATVVPVAFAAATVPTDAQLTDCFKMHSQRMGQKPGVITLVSCWRVHGNLMDRS
jgi:hypothetical protein